VLTEAAINGQAERLPRSEGKRHRRSFDPGRAGGLAYHVIAAPSSVLVSIWPKGAELQESDQEVPGETLDNPELLDDLRGFSLEFRNLFSRRSGRVCCLAASVVF